MKQILEKFHPIIKKYEIIEWDSEPTSYRFKAKFTFIDDSQLMVRDYMLANSGRKYAFHWQDRKNGLITRWDNAIHWKNIDTFPHHSMKAVVYFLRGK